MWRRFGDAFYAVLVLVVFTVETIALVTLSWAFIVRRSGLISADRVQTAAFATVLVTLGCLMVVLLYVLTYHALSGYRENYRRSLLERWTDRWVGVLYNGDEAPGAIPTKEGIEALLDLSEQLKGAEADRLCVLAREYGVADSLLHKAAPRPLHPSGMARVGSVWRRATDNPRRLARRLDAIDGLAKARLPEAFDALVELVSDPEPAVRVMALRALGRTVARMPLDPGHSPTADAFVATLQGSDAPRGVLEEALVVLEDSAEAVTTRLMKGGSLNERLLPSAIESAGRLRLLAVADHLAPLCSHPEAEVRAASIRALGRMGFIPESATDAVERALTDEEGFVRVQAVRTSVLLDQTVAIPALRRALGDPSWWVRRAAAEALLRVGMDGPRALHRAARRHTDRYARQMAVQVLLDAGKLTPVEARRLREPA